jgi:hypothetical protein
VRVTKRLIGKTLFKKWIPQLGVDTVKKVIVKMPKTADLNEAHDVCRHEGEALLRKTCKRLGVKLTGTLKPCKGCGYAKARVKTVSSDHYKSC